MTEPTRKPGKVLDAVDRGEYPIRLEPRERGQIIDASPDTWCQAVRLLVKRAGKAGYQTRVTYSRFLAAPPYAGKHKGQPVETHTQYVRMRHDLLGLRMYAGWHGIEDEGWSPQGGQALWLGYRSMPLSVTQIEGIISGKVKLTPTKSGFWSTA